MPNTGMWMQAAAGAAQGATALGLQRLGVNYDNRKQYEQQQKLSELQIQNESKLMDIQNQKQYEQWVKTGPQGQIEQYKAAGLNPALMYGISGGGGQSTGGPMPNINTATAENPHTSQAGGKIMEIAQMGMAQMELLKAQKENIEADTANKKAEIPVKGAQVPNIEADTKNKQTELSRIQAQTQNIAEDTVKRVQEIEQLRINNKINRASAQDQIDKIHAEAIGQVLQNSLTKTKTNLNQQEWEQNIQRLAIQWEHLGVEKQELALKQLTADYGDASDDIIKTIRTIIEGIIAGKLLKSPPKAIKPY